MKRSSDPRTASLETVSAPGDSETRVRVSGVLDFDTVPELMRQASSLLSDAGSIVVDFSGVSNCNSAGLAVILEMARLMRQREKKICFQSLPEQIHTFARAYSVEKALAEANLLC